MTMVATPGNYHDNRLWIAILVATILHGVAVFSIGFKPQPYQSPANTIEITLAQHPSTTTPEESNYLAQFDQQGSGDREKSQEITSDRVALLEAPEFRETDIPVPAATEQAQQTRQEQQLIATRSQSAATSPQEQQPEEALSQQPKAAAETAREIASLRAQLDQQRQLHSKMPRTLVLTAVSARSSEQAGYLRRWIDWVETIGNDNYPEEARRRKIFGAIRLAVSIERDGNVVGIEILQSSGQRVLDQAAIRIVRLAAPFEPFPQSIKEDHIEVIRTWNFIPGNLFSTSAQ